MSRPIGQRIQVYDVGGRPVELCGFFQRSDVFAPSIAVGGHPDGKKVGKTLLSAISLMLIAGDGDCNA